MINLSKVKRGDRFYDYADGFIRELEYLCEKPQAIKLYKAKMNVGLREAKDYIDNYFKAE